MGAAQTGTARLILLLAVAAVLGTSCSLKKMAVRTVADVLGEADLVYLSDEDPELVAAALPFNLKTIETLLASNPDNRDLLLTATKAFTLYAYGFVQPEAERIESQDFDRAEEIRGRAARLYRRAYDYGLRGLEVEHHGFRTLLPVEPERAASGLGVDDVPLAVYAAGALGGTISVSKDDPESTADIAVVGALLHRSLELDEDFEDGTIHQLLLAYESGRVGGTRATARTHYERALALGQGKECPIWLSWAESISVAEQNRQEFEDLLNRVVSFDVDAHPENRLMNILAQRRARWLLERADELFLEQEERS